MPEANSPPEPNGKRTHLTVLLRTLHKRPRPRGQRLLDFCRRPGWKRWLPPLGCLLLAILVGLTLLGKMKREVWAYFTDDQGTRVEVEDGKTRYVLWEDPRPATFQPQQDSEEDRATDPANQPGGRLEAAFSPDGTTMVLVRWKDPALEKNADLYLSRWDGRLWSPPKPIVALNTDRYHERSPAFSRDGRSLYFSSNRPGGEGGHDLYLARWNGESWNGIESLGPDVNSPADESGPAPSAADDALYFSSNRSGARGEDIYIAKRLPSPPEGSDQSNLPSIPRFSAAQSVTHLNSRQADVQAALAARGNHIFIASDRERTRDAGYRIYFSRVVEGVSRPPEQVDLYLDTGDLTDPAVRMDGFDLLFSSNHEATGHDRDGYRLYRSTTREVIGYTDLSRWEQFKELLNGIGWWILLALAALLALLYLLEKWRDITSLFHKCLAGSAAVHLLLLVLMMVWLIAKELEKGEEPPPTEIAISLDALAQEELALESIPEETAITEPDLSLPTEKIQSNFDLPDFQPRDQSVPNATPIDSEFQKEAVQVEVHPATAQTSEPPRISPAESSPLLTDLSEPTLPEPAPAVLEERQPDQIPEPPARPSEEPFRPVETLPAAAEQTTPSELTNRPDAAPAEADAITPAESIAGAPTPATEGRPAQAEQSNNPADSAEPLQSELLTELPESAPLSTTPLLEESSGESPAATDPSRDLFQPGDTLRELTSGPARGKAPDDSPAQSPTGTGAVAKGTTASSLANEGPASTTAEAAVENSPPAPLSDAGFTRVLPQSALLDPGAPQLDEGIPQQNDRPPNPGPELFVPPNRVVKGATRLETTPLEGGREASPTEGTEVAAATPTVEPAKEGSAPSVTEAAESAPLPEAVASTLPTDLPSQTLLDPGLPRLEESDPGAGEPANATANRFQPANGPSIATPAAGPASASTPASDTLDPEAVAATSTTPTQPKIAAPLTGLEARESDLPTGGTLNPASLGPSLAASLLPDQLDPPEDNGAMTDFLKKQRGRPSLDVIKQLGGSDGTEKAIRASLRWLAENQEEEGHWDARQHGAKGDFDTGVTGLALLCFYGWGARHDQHSEYQDHVARALHWLLTQQEEDGDLSGGGLMYCHAIASIALCEAFGITNDQALREPAERAMTYTLSAQSKTKGGWRYHPGDDSDTSITGWQYMALHSARLAGLEIPEQSFALVRRWLDRVSGGKFGGLYGYQAPARNSPAMVATGMFCRQLDLLPPTDPRQNESAAFLKIHPMKSRNLDLYYIYYATLALYQHQGPTWDAWNGRLKEILPLNQLQTGPHAGSWEASRGLAGNGGRVTSTTLATLSLEVYYRILPMYGFRGDNAPPTKEKRSASP